MTTTATIARLRTGAAFGLPHRRVQTGAGPIGCLDGGTAAPAVVFVGGAGGSALAWEPVRARVAAATRAFAFDRPGYGTSPYRVSGGVVTSPRRLADELVDVLSAAGVPTPVILVAHSFGGFIARAFAATHPQLVAGLVLVDAVHEEEWSERYPDAHRRGLALAGRTLATLAAAAKVGLPQLLARLPFVPLGAVDRLPHPYRRLARRLGARRASLRTASAEFAGLEAAAREMPEYSDLGDLPLVVVAHGRPGPVRPGVSAEDAARLEELAQNSQRSLAGLSSRGRLVLADTGHDVHIDAPDLVADAVLKLVVELRQQRPAARPAACLAQGPVATEPPPSQ